MSNNKLQLWRDSIAEYSDANGLKYIVPKKGTKEYTGVKKIYEAKCNQKDKKKSTCKVYCKKADSNCKTNCQCPK
jgi:hypothetical protein